MKIGAFVVDNAAIEVYHGTVEIRQHRSDAHAPVQVCIVMDKVALSRTGKSESDLLIELAADLEKTVAQLRKLSDTLRGAE